MEYEQGKELGLLTWVRSDDYVPHRPLQYPGGLGFPNHEARVRWDIVKTK